jgi:hypothetical protein
MMPDPSVISVSCGDARDGGDTYVIEVAHHDRYNWSSCYRPKMEGAFRKLCELFLNLPAYDGSILEAQVSEVKASWIREYHSALKVQSAQEIEAELQALKGKLT